MLGLSTALLWSCLTPVAVGGAQVLGQAADLHCHCPVCQSCPALLLVQEQERHA